MSRKPPWNYLRFCRRHMRVSANELRVDSIRDIGQVKLFRFAANFGLKITWRSRSPSLLDDHQLCPAQVHAEPRMLPRAGRAEGSPMFVLGPRDILLALSVLMAARVGRPLDRWRRIPGRVADFCGSFRVDDIESSLQ